jgi:hypothetical protein
MFLIFVAAVFLIILGMKGFYRGPVQDEPQKTKEVCTCARGEYQLREYGNLAEFVCLKCGKKMDITDDW